jgi:CTP:molybdopterin cytidylyltransferase MocA
MIVAGLVLAAGAGRRYGRPKALLEVDGRRFVDLAVQTLRDGGADPVFVVVGATEIGHVDAIVIANPRWHEGVGSSLVAGLAAATAYDQSAAPIAGVIVVLVDQPRLGSEAVGRVLAAARGGAHAAVATYEDIALQPVFLSADSWAGVSAVAKGERGAKPYLEANPDLIERVPCDGTGDPTDVDTPADLEALVLRPSDGNR